MLNSIMDGAKFDTLITGQLTRCGELLKSKGDEYSPGVDRLAAFRKAAHLQECSVAQAAFGMLAKHLVSVADMVATPNAYDVDRWEEKITDSINYLLILRAIIQEDVQNEAN